MRRPNVLCECGGDRCLGCKHYYGLADKCEKAAANSMRTTKGPWIVRGDILEATVEHTDGENRSIIARCYGMSLCEEHGGDALSNAMFIAESYNEFTRLQRIEAAA